MTWLERHAYIKLNREWTVSRRIIDDQACACSGRPSHKQPLMLTGLGLVLPRHIVHMGGTCRLCRLES